MHICITYVVYYSTIVSFFANRWQNRLIAFNSKQKHLTGNNQFLLWNTYKLVFLLTAISTKQLSWFLAVLNDLLVTISAALCEM